MGPSDDLTAGSISAQTELELSGGWSLLAAAPVLPMGLARLFIYTEEGFHKREPSCAIHVLQTSRGKRRHTDAVNPGLSNLGT